MLTKQIHIRLNDKIYHSLTDYSTVTNKPVQDCVTEALVLMLDDRNKEEQKNGRFTFIDLFAGIGGMRLAFESCGGQCVFSSEWDRYCQKTSIRFASLITCRQRSLQVVLAPRKTSFLDGQDRL